MLPLCVDLDGSLIHCDILHDSSLAMLKQHPFDVVAIPIWLMRSKAHMKQEIAERVSIDVATLPYNTELMNWLRSEKAKGRKLVLATASNKKYADEIADHLGIFDEVLGSDGETNLSANSKASRLVARFGVKGFDYIGNSTKDLAVWEVAKNAIVVGSESLAARVAQVSNVEQRFSAKRAGLKGWIKGLRLHQWLKNLLVFLPLVGAHRWSDIGALSQVFLAFVAFGFSASAVYLLNDLLDVDSDRLHPRKRNRPFAAGIISAPLGLAVLLALLVAGLSLATTLGSAFLSWMIGYLVLTTGYSFKLKQFPLIDCLALAGLYTIRIVAGGAAISQSISFWLLAFSLFLFLSLAFIKRYSELIIMIKAGAGSAHGRGYIASDQQLLQSIGLASGFSSALVMALYLNSADVRALYSHPQLLWLTMPILLFWVCWVWLKASRDEMHDDPVVFAVRDPTSLIAGMLFIAVIWFAS